MEDVSRAVMTFLVNVAWQTPIFAVVAVACDRWLRRAPVRYRHQIWIMALGLSLALPLWSVTTVVAADSAPPAAHVRAVGSNGATFSGVGELSSIATGALPLGAIDFPPLLLYVAMVCYAAFLVGRTARLWWGWQQTKAIRERAYEHDLGPLMETVSDQCRRALGLGHVPILCSSEVAGPLAVGALRPVVVLPLRAFSVTSSDLVGSIIGHEMAHVRRRDFIQHVALEVLCTPIAFHPAATWIRRRIAATRELACDELVTETLVTPSAYARALLAVAASIRAKGRAGYSLGILEAGNLEQRIRTLCQPRRPLRIRVARAVLVLSAATLVVVATMASAFSVSASQGSTAVDVQRQLVGTWRGRWEDVLVPTFTSRIDSSPIWLQFRTEGSRVVGTAWHDGIDLIDQPGTDVKILQVFPKNTTAPLEDITATDRTVSFKAVHHGEIQEYQLEILEEQRGVLKLKTPRGLDGGQQFQEWLTLTRQ